MTNEPAFMKRMRQSPITQAIFVLCGLIFIPIFSVQGLVVWQELRKMPDHPVQITLEQLAVNNSELPYWVAIQNRDWDCGSIVFDTVGSTPNTFALLHSSNNEIVAMAFFSGQQSCNQLKSAATVGTIERMNASRYSFYANKGFFTNYKDATTYFEVCALCGPTNSQTGVAFNAVAVICGFALVFMGIRGFRKARALRQSEKVSAPKG